jgi:hypothetical protein
MSNEIMICKNIDLVAIDQAVADVVIYCAQWPELTWSLQL